MSARNIKEAVIHRERKEGRFSLLFGWRRGALLPVYRKTTWITGVTASVGQPRQTVSSVCFSCVLYCHFIREWVSALSLLPGQILSHDYALGWNQITGRCRTWCSESQYESLFFHPLAWIVGSACATFPQISSRCTGLWKYFSINLLIRPTHSPIWSLPYFFLLLFFLLPYLKSDFLLLEHL